MKALFCIIRTMCPVCNMMPKIDAVCCLKLGKGPGHANPTPHKILQAVWVLVQFVLPGAFSSNHKYVKQHAELQARLRHPANTGFDSPTPRQR